MSDVFFLSGWAGPEMLFPGLSDRWLFAAPFLDGDEATLLDCMEKSGARVLGGWSTGAHMIVKHAARLLPRFERVVLVAPFLRFGDSFPARVTKAMIAGMASDPEATTRAFWKNCGVPGNPLWQPAWTAPLAAGLGFLLTSAAPAAPVLANHVTVLHGSGDRIVRPTAVEKTLAVLSGARLTTIPSGHYPDQPSLTAQLF